MFICIAASITLKNTDLLLSLPTTMQCGTSRLESNAGPGVGRKDHVLRIGQWGHMQGKSSCCLAEVGDAGWRPSDSDWTCTLYLSTRGTFPGDGQKYHCLLGTVL